MMTCFHCLTEEKRERVAELVEEYKKQNRDYSWEDLSVFICTVENPTLDSVQICYFFDLIEKCKKQ